jgi:2-C-methyl-D-erythritol 2,4-cyclodiphosphate synthase
MIRVGHGYDVHAFAAGRPLMLGGVHVPSERGLAGHSDADVLLHAICDACLGAAGLGDIGRHFPDTDPALKGIDSRVLLRRVAAALAEAGWRIGNVDATVVAQAPRLAPYIEVMQRNIAEDLQVVGGAVNVKATTTERLGFAGREEGIAAHAVVLIEATERPA